MGVLRVRPGQGRCRRRASCAARNPSASSRRPTALRSTRSRPTACCTCRAAFDLDDVRRAARGRHERHHDARRALRRRAQPRRRRTSARPRRMRARRRRRSTRRGAVPGFITDALPFALLSLQRRVESIEIEEFANLSRRDSPHLLFELMGFGQPIDSYDPSRSSYLLGEFGPPLGVLAEAAGRPVDEWTCTGEVAAARARRRRSSRASSRRGRWPRSGPSSSGTSDGAEVVRFTADLVLHRPSSSPRGICRPTGWRVRVRGDAPLDVDAHASRSRSRTSRRSRPRTPRTAR